MIAELAEAAELVGRRLSIVRPVLAEPLYELRWERRLVARLQRRSRVSRVAVGEAADGRWTFRASGHPFRRYTADAEGEGHTAALLDTATEILTLGDGRTLRWAPGRGGPGWWALVADAPTPSDPGIEVVRFHERLAGSRRGEVEIDPVAASAPEVLSLLALMGAYRLILRVEARPGRARRGA